MIEFKEGQMFKMPTGEVLKIKDLGRDEFACRLFGLKGAWTDFHVKGEVEKLHLFFTEGGAEFVDAKDYGLEPAADI